MAARADVPTLVGVISALGVGSACGDPCADTAFVPPPEPQLGTSITPEVIGGEWIDPGLLELSFSEPLGATGPLDPRRFAVLSWDVSNEADNSTIEGTCYMNTRYRPLQDGYYQTNGVADVWIAPEDPTLLRLRLRRTTAQCLLTTTSVGSGLMLAYTNSEQEGAGGRLLDELGNPVFDLGPAWASSRLEDCFGCEYITYTAWGSHLPQFASLAQIPCP
jgi:hypothetical protein